MLSISSKILVTKGIVYLFNLILKSSTFQQLNTSCQKQLNMASFTPVSLSRRLTSSCTRENPYSFPKINLGRNQLMNHWYNNGKLWRCWDLQACPFVYVGLHRDDVLACLHKITVFLTQIISLWQKMPTRKLHYRFHVGKNGIRVGNFQKIVFFQIFN